MIYLQLFLSFLQVGLFSVGGGYAALPLIQDQVVGVHGWITLSEFSNLITIAEMTPGPVALNSATFVGIRIAGIPGAVVATIGFILPSCLIVSLLAHIYRKYKNVSTLQCVLSSLRPVVVALIASAGFSILSLVIFSGEVLKLSGVDWIGAGIFLAAFVILRKWKWNPILIMGLCGVAGAGLHLLLR